jgi:hypothetical protein
VSNIVTTNETEHSDIEDFLIKMSQNPLLRKTSAKTEGEDEVFNEDNTHDDDEDEEDCKNDDTMVDIDMQEVEQEQEQEVTTDCDRVSDMDDRGGREDEDEDEDGLLVEAPRDYNFNADNDSKRFSVRNFASGMTARRNREAEQLTARQMDATVMRRGGILVEIVRGIIGAEEWEQGQTLNIFR